MRRRPERIRVERGAPLELVVMARWPAPGRCKRRLASGCGPVRAAAVQARLTIHTLTAAARARQRARATDPARRLVVVLAVEGIGPRAARRWGRRLGADRVRRQGRGSLGLRMRRQLLQSRRAGARAVVLIGSDLPGLEAADLLAAFAALEQGAREQSALVLGPACDGGYWLIGVQGHLRQAALAGLFSGTGAAIGWGGPQVLARTLAAADAAGLVPRLLAERADLDRPADLEAWR
ncbi:MAG: TIGR04282 family arsenosugar biosynthesis glycosyltransferase [Cyanobium sp.]